MTEVTFQKQVLERLDRVEKTMRDIREYLEDSRLSGEEKQLLGESYRHEKDGKLLSSSEMSKKLAL